MGHNYNIDFYFYYLIIGVVLTGLLSILLFVYGGKFLADVFQKDEEFARRTNVLLLVSFLLFNIGYLFLTANPGVEIVNGDHLFQKAVYRIGIFVVVLGIEHTLSLLGLYMIRKNRQSRNNLNNEG